MQSCHFKSLAVLFCQRIPLSHSLNLSFDLLSFCPLTPSCHDELKNYKALLELLITGNVFDGRRHRIT